MVSVCLAQSAMPQLPQKDAVRIHEFYRLEAQIAGKVWPDWGSTPAPILLVTNESEFLVKYPHPPADFKKIADDLYVRSHQFPTDLQATFPAFGPPSLIVIGEAENTDAKATTPWVIILMHEHFHQLQDAHPGLLEAIEKLGLAHGDKTGMWMLNYPFPYEKPELVHSFAHLRDLLLTTLSEPDPGKFRFLARQYVVARKQFFSRLSADDHKYLSFQVWKEGIARYVQVKSAEAAAAYQPTSEYSALPDYESFASYADRARRESLDELKKIDMSQSKRVVVYSFGAAEGFLLDRLNPEWRLDYFKHPLTLDPYFEK